MLQYDAMYGVVMWFNVVWCAICSVVCSDVM